MWGERGAGILTSGAAFILYIYGTPKYVNCVTESSEFTEIIVVAECCIHFVHLPSRTCHVFLPPVLHSFCTSMVRPEYPPAALECTCCSYRPTDLSLPDHLSTMVSQWYPNGTPMVPPMVPQWYPINTGRMSTQIKYMKNGNILSSYYI